VREIGKFEGSVANDRARRRHPMVRQCEKVLQQSEFVQNFERGRVDSVAAKIAVEVGMLLKHFHSDSLPGQQVTEHHSRRTTSHNAASRFQKLNRHNFPLSAEMFD
jgi:hypothetical protein